MRIYMCFFLFLSSFSGSSMDANRTDLINKHDLLDPVDLKTFFQEETNTETKMKIGNACLRKLILLKSEAPNITVIDIPSEDEFNNPNIEKLSTAMGTLVRRKQPQDLHDRVMRDFSFLIENNVIPSGENVEMAMRFGELDCLKKMQQVYTITEENIRNSFIEKESFFNKKTLEYLVDSNMYNVNEIISGYPRLAFAVLSLNEELIQFLLDKGADKNARVTASFAEFSQIHAIGQDDVLLREDTEVSHSDPKDDFIQLISGKTASEIWKSIIDQIEKSPFTLDTDEREKISTISERLGI